MFYGEPVKRTVAFMRVDNIENLYAIDGGTIRFFQLD